MSDTIHGGAREKPIELGAMEMVFADAGGSARRSVRE